MSVSWRFHIVQGLNHDFDIISLHGKPVNCDKSIKNNGKEKVRLSNIKNDFKKQLQKQPISVPIDDKSYVKNMLPTCWKVKPQIAMFERSEVFRRPKRFVDQY